MLGGALPGETRPLGGKTQFAQPLVQREVCPTQLIGGKAEQLVAMTDVATRTTATPDALAFAEATGLVVTDAICGKIVVNDSLMGAPDAKRARALERGSTHGLTPPGSSRKPSPNLR